jgi:glycerate 2-kinase
MNRAKNLARLRKDARSIFLAGVDAVNPKNAIRKYARLKDNQLIVNSVEYDLNRFENIYVIGAGKASAAMAQAVEELLGERINSGLVNTKYGHGLPLGKVQLTEAGHPVPDEAGFRGAQKIVQLLEKTGKKDLVIFLISGGGSALLPYPADGLSLEDKQTVTKTLLEVGANIHEINALRKHLSLVKGGRLARFAFPSTLISLILSDVIGDDLDSIASGPTVPDQSTFGVCIHILEKYQIKDRVPPAVVGLIEKGARGKIEESPKSGDPVFERTQNVIIGSNIQAVDASRTMAHDLGYNTLILSTFIQGETKDVANVHAAVAKEILSSGNPLGSPACVISGGETTVTIRGKGLGGRNQEFVLAAAIDIAGWQDVVVLSAGTDGTDGPTDAAGAIADGTSIERAENMGMNADHFLRKNDSYHFFQALGDLIVTGPTHTNVMDLRLVLTSDIKR